MKQPKSACRAWFVFIFATFGILYQFYLQSAPAVMISGLHASFALSAGQLGFLTSVFFYTYLFFQIPAGLLVDYIGPKKALMIGFVGCGLGCIGFALAGSYEQAILWRLFMGISSAVFVPAALVTAMGLFPVERFAVCAGLAESIGMTGGVFGEGGIAHVVTLFGWRHTMFYSGVLGLCFAVLSFFVLRGLAPVAEKHGSFRLLLLSAWQSLRQVVCYRNLWLLAAFAGLTFALLATFAGLWAVPFFEERYRVLADQSALLSSLIFLGVAICAPFVGMLYSRIQQKGRLLLALVLSTGVIFTYLVCVPMGVVSTAVLLFFLGGCSSVYVLAFAMIPGVLPERYRGAGSGLVNMGAMLIGALLLQPLIGWWLDKANQVAELRILHYQEGLLTLSVLLLLALFLVKYLPIPMAPRQ